MSSEDKRWSLFISIIMFIIFVSVGIPYLVNVVKLNRIKELGDVKCEPSTINCGQLQCCQYSRLNDDICLSMDYQYEISFKVEYNGQSLLIPGKTFHYCTDVSGYNDQNLGNLCPNQFALLKQQINTDNLCNLDPKDLSYVYLDTKDMESTYSFTNIFFISIILSFSSFLIFLFAFFYYRHELKKFQTSSTSNVTSSV